MNIARTPGFRTSGLFAALAGAALLGFGGCSDDDGSADTDVGTGTVGEDGVTPTSTTVTPPTTMTAGTTGDGTGTPTTGDGTDTTMGAGSSTGTMGMADSSSGDDTAGMNACADEALPATLPIAVTADTTGAGDDFDLDCSRGNGEDYVFEFTAPQDGTFIIDTVGSEVDTILAVYPACSGASLACNDDLQFPEIVTSVLDVTLAADETIIIVVDAWDGPGSFTLNLDLAPPPPDDGYGDCTDGQESCEPGETCLTANDIDDAGTGVAVCAYGFCETAADCPDAPATGNAPVGCLDATGTGALFCALDCINRETCPDGMICYEDAGVCVFELPPPAATDGGTCCVDSTGGVAGSGTPGCDVAAIESCVCGINVGDAACCIDEWDAQCATEAETLCNAICG